MSEWTISRRDLLASAVALLAGRADAACPNPTGNASDGWGPFSPKELQEPDVHAQPQEPPQGLPAFSWDGTGVPQVLPRRNAGQIDAPTAMSMDSAYQSLVSGSAKPTKPNPASIGSQAYLHLMYCHGGATSIHVTGNFFLAWHRAAMFFHERLIQWVLMDSTFRLPYWEPSSNFGIYGSGHLNHPRGIKSAIPILPGSLLQIGDFPSFTDVINDWHRGVHAAFCGDFGMIPQAGLDPLFYGFHTFVDRVWEASQVKGQMESGRGWGLFFNPYQWNQNPTDARSGWVWVDLTKFNNPSDWGYSYDPPLSPDTLVEPSGLIFRDIPLGNRHPRTYKISGRRKAGGKATTLAVLEPFGHLKDPYHRVDMDQARVNKLLDGSWEFVVTPDQQQAPIAILGRNQVVSAR